MIYLADKLKPTFIPKFCYEYTHTNVYFAKYPKI